MWIDFTLEVFSGMQYREVQSVHYSIQMLPKNLNLFTQISLDFSDLQ